MAASIYDYDFFIPYGQGQMSLETQYLSADIQLMETGFAQWNAQSRTVLL